MLSRLERRVVNTANLNRSLLFTVHELPHILDESMDNSERMSRSNPNLVLRQPVKPIQHCFDVLLLEIFLGKFNCVVMSKVKHRRDQTHLIVAA